MKLDSFKIPTAVAISGKCFGMGLEFVLHCKYRIASNTSDTQFSSNEISNSFIPGSTVYIGAYFRDILHGQQSEWNIYNQNNELH